MTSCAELYVATFREPPWNEEWSTGDAFERLNDVLTCPKPIAIKAVCNGEIGGFLFGEIQQWNGVALYYLKEVCVSSAIQRRGIGKALMGKLEKMLREKEVSKIYLITQRDSLPSKFYSSLGFFENKTIIVMGKSVEKSSYSVSLLY